MVKRTTLVIFSLIFLNLPAAAEIKIILSGRCDIKSPEAKLTLGDIASIECSAEDCAPLISKTIDEKYYNDGFIDKDEISEIVKSSNNDLLIIYGSAVRIIKDSNVPSINTLNDINIKDLEIVVKKGDLATLTLMRNGISIEIYGKAMSDGRIGDIITVEVKLTNAARAKLIKGKVSGRNQVEVEI